MMGTAREWAIFAALALQEIAARKASELGRAFAQAYRRGRLRRAIRAYARAVTKR